MILSHRGVRLRSCGDVRYATALPPNVLQTIFAAQIQEAIDVPFPGPLLEVWTRERASDNFSRERRKRTVACRLEYRRWPENDQAKSLFNRSSRASLPARLAAAVVSK